MFHSARCITGASVVCNMPAPYSEDLRWRAIWIRHFCGYSEEETCFHLGISKWTLRRYLHGYFVSGDVKAKKIGRPLGSLHFQPPEELIIMEAVLENATVSLNEIFDQIYRSTGSEFALSSLHYYFQRNGITRQKGNLNICLPLAWFKLSYISLTICPIYRFDRLRRREMKNFDKCTGQIFVCLTLICWWFWTRVDL